MRAVEAGVAVVGLLLLSSAIVLSGQQLKRPAVSVDAADMAELDAVEDMPEPPEDAPDVDAASGLERVAPRPPLSELSTPQAPRPPKSTPPERWRPTRLFNPVATAAGQVEADGHRVAFSGIEALPLDEKCSAVGPDWPCGVQARTAFRSWLRGRALLCKLPLEPERQLIVADCRVGNEDPAQWLVSNGWARAAAGGPYVEFAQKAEAEGKGLFGAAPKRVTTGITPAQLEPQPGQPAGPDSDEASVPPPGFPPAPTSPAQ